MLNVVTMAVNGYIETVRVSAEWIRSAQCQ